MPAEKPPWLKARWPAGEAKVRFSRKTPAETRVSCTMSGTLGP